MSLACARAVDARLPKGTGSVQRLEEMGEREMQIKWRRAGETLWCQARSTSLVATRAEQSPRQGEGVEIAGMSFVICKQVAQAVEVTTQKFVAVKEERPVGLFVLFGIAQVAQRLPLHGFATFGGEFHMQYPRVLREGVQQCCATIGAVMAVNQHPVKTEGEMVRQPFNDIGAIIVQTGHSQNSQCDPLLSGSYGWRADGHYRQGCGSKSPEGRCPFENSLSDSHVRRAVFSARIGLVR